jgi:hypothetical protein
MVSKKEVISGLIILIAVPSTLFVLSYVGVIQNLMSAIEQVITGVLATVFGAGFLLILKGIRKKDEKIPAMASEKKKGLLSRLRFSIRKERRIDVGQSAIASVIFGPILIIIMFTIVPSETLASQASVAYTFIKIASICVGIGLTAWGALLLSNLLLDTWEARQRPIRQRRNEYLKVTKDFDNAFEAVQQVSDTTTKRIMLTDFQKQLVKLTKYEWNQVKDRIEEVLGCLIPDNFSKEPHMRSYIAILNMIIHHYCENVIHTINKKWLKELEGMYDDPNYPTDDIVIILNILQKLHRYSADYLEKLIDDATRWSQMKFSLLSHNIGFSELKERDETAYNKVLQYLRRKMDDAGKNESEETFKRLETLYSIAK